MSFGPSILDGKLRYVSVSQIEKFDPETYGGCKRRWWFRYKAHKPEPPIKAQRLGVQVHAQIEHYLRTGEDTLGELARAGRRFIPRPIPEAPGLAVELQIGRLWEHLPGGAYGLIVSDLDAAGVPVIGFVDVLNGRGSSENENGEVVVEPDVVEALDWKTTKQIDDEVDPQTGLVVSKGYAKTAEDLSKTHQMVGYGEFIRRRFPSVFRVRQSHVVFQTKGQRKAVKRSALVTVEEIRERWRRSEALVEEMKAVALVEDATQVPANLAACEAYGGCPHRSSCPRNPKAVLAAMLTGGKMGLLDKIRAKTEAPTENAAAPPTPPDPARTTAVPAPPEPSAIAAEVAALAAQETAVRGSTSIVPPDAPAPSTAPEPAKKTRKAKAAAAEVMADHAETLSRLATPEGLVLYLNAIEDGVTFKRLETYAYGLADELAKNAGAADVRCAPDKSELAFGRWKGALAACAKSDPPPPGAYLASMSDEIVAVVAEALAPTAARVVRGIR